MQTLQCIFLITVFIGFIITPILSGHYTSHLHLDTRTILRTSSDAGDTQGGNEHVSFALT